jgi:hypothetical protein
MAMELRQGKPLSKLGIDAGAKVGGRLLSRHTADSNGVILQLAQCRLTHHEGRVE